MLPEKLSQHSGRILHKILQTKQGLSRLAPGFLNLSGGMLQPCLHEVEQTFLFIQRIENLPPLFHQGNSNDVVVLPTEKNRNKSVSQITNDHTLSVISW